MEMYAVQYSPTGKVTGPQKDSNENDAGELADDASQLSLFFCEQRGYGHFEHQEI